MVGEVMMSNVFILCILFLGCLGVFCTDDDTVLMPDDARRSYYDIGLIDEMGSREGDISTMVRDFYNLSSVLRTGIVLHVTDSKEDSRQSIATALDLFENVQVHTIISPTISNEKWLLPKLGAKDNVPPLPFSSLLSSSQHPYYIQVDDVEISQFHGNATLIKTIKWKSLAFSYEDTPDARLSQTYVHAMFPENHLDIAYQTANLFHAAYDQIVNELHKLMMTKASNFGLHLSPSLASQVYINAKMFGVVNNGFAWIVTSMTRNLLEPKHSSFYDSTQGVLGFKSRILVSSKLQNLTVRWKGDFQHLESNLKTKQPNIVGLWAYEAAWILAVAIENVTGQTSQDQIGALESKHMDLARMKVSNSGPFILSKITSSKASGVYSVFQVTNMKLLQGAYEIRNIICKVDRRVGFCKASHGLVKDLNSHHNFSYVFLAALDKLPCQISPEFVSFNNEYASYNDLLQPLYHHETFDAVVCDTAILPNRSTYVNLAPPYTEPAVGGLARHGGRLDEHVVSTDSYPEPIALHSDKAGNGGMFLAGPPRRVLKGGTLHMSTFHWTLVYVVGVVSVPTTMVFIWGIIVRMQTRDELQLSNIVLESQVDEDMTSTGRSVYLYGAISSAAGLFVMVVYVLANKYYKK